MVGFNRLVVLEHCDPQWLNEHFWSFDVNITVPGAHSTDFRLRERQPDFGAQQQMYAP